MAAELLFQLKTLIEVEEVPPYPPLNEVTSILAKFSTAIKEGGPDVRHEVNELDAYDTIIKIWTMYCDTGESQVRDLSPEAEQVRLSTLEALCSITAGYPDLMDPRGFVMITQAIDTRIPEPTQLMALRVIRNICRKSEENRDILASFFQMIPPLVDVLRKNSPSSEFVHEWCSAMKSLLLADDKRVAYNRSAERKRILYEARALPYLSQLLNEFPEDGPTLNAIVVLLGSMACRDNYCISMEAAGVLPGIQHILTKKHSHQLLTKHTLSLLRFINVSAMVREKVCGYGLMEHVLRVAYLYRTGADMVEIAMSCCAFMTLRSPCHVAQFLTEAGVEKVMEIIKGNMDHLPVLKGACLVLRNVAVHGSKRGKRAILEADGEHLIRQIEDKYPEIKYNYTKPVLRDIRAPVSPPTELGKAVSEALLDLSVGRAVEEKDPVEEEEAPRAYPFETECVGVEEQPRDVRMKTGSSSNDDPEEGEVSSQETQKLSTTPTPRNSKAEDQTRSSSTVQGPRKSLGERKPEEGPRSGSVPGKSPRESTGDDNEGKTRVSAEFRKSPRNSRGHRGQLPDEGEVKSTPRNSANARTNSRGSAEGK